MRNSGWNMWRQLCLSQGMSLGKSVRLAASAAVLMTATLLVAPSALALGLGEIDTRSALNERFAAEIELLDTRDLDANEVIASLASTDDFRRVGVERFFFLTSLKFAVVRNSRDNLVIKATSAQPITEPYLNFLVEVLWPSGRLLKEYTVLLDPPTFTHSTAAPVAAPSRQSTDIASAGRVQRNQPEPAPSSATDAGTASTGARVRTPAPRVDANDGTYGRTTRNDTMWAIANQTLPSNSVTPQQNMIAIQRLNPNAFIDGNVNLLKAGVVLRLPSEGDAQATDNATAVAQIDEQNRAWRSGTPARSVAAAPQDADVASGQTNAAPIDATSRGPGRADAAQKSADGRLTIVATDAAGVVDGLDNTGAGEVQTAGDPAAQERIETLARQVDELTYQLDLQKRGVEEQISSREKQISLKDQQIAQLQNQLQAAQDAGPTQSQDQSTSQSSEAEAKPFWQQPTILGAVLGGLALLLAGVLFKRRQVNAAEDLELDDFESSEPSFELGPTGTSEVVTPLADADLVGDLSDADLALETAGTVSQDADLVEGFDAAADSNELSDDDLFGPSDDMPASAAGDDAPQTSDVIGEADIYIAYGRYPQAIALLQGAVETNPADHAVRLRLLEVSAETKDAVSYAEQARLLHHYCDDATTLASAESLYSSLDDDLRSQIDALTVESGDDDSSLLSGTAAAAAGGALIAGAASLLDGDSDELDSSELIDDFESADEPMSFDLDTAETDDLSASLDELSAATDGLPADTDSLLTGDFDLSDIDGDSASDVAAAADEFELDLGDEIETLTDTTATDFDVPSVDTDEFATNVDIEPVDVDLGIEAAAELEDFELDLDLESDASEAFTAEFDAGSSDSAADSLGGDLGLDFPDDASELERVVAETDDDELLDEIERSLDELEADGLLTPDLNEDAEFSFDDDADTSATKLDLARAYIDMGDDDGAREILGEVISEGDSNQQGEASELLDKL